MSLHSRALTVPVLVLLATSLVAGCIGQGNGDASTLNLSYDGQQSGSHESTGACAAKGTLAGHGSITDGSVRIQVVDGSGNTRFDKTYSANFTIPSQELSGASGSWKISGSRASNDLAGDQFQGSYSITQTC